MATNATTGPKISGIVPDDQIQTDKSISKEDTLQEPKLCLFKFYDFNKDSDREWRNQFFVAYGEAILEYGCVAICEFINELNADKNGTKFRFIYTYRYMGITSFFKAIEKIWTGQYSGSNNAYRRYTEKRQCKYLSFLPYDGKIEKGSLTEKISDDIKLWKDKVSFKKGCPCGAIEEAIIRGICFLICGEISSMEESQYKRLLLLDDFDAFLCNNKMELSFYFIWFYRKCWLKAIIRLNKNDKLNAIIIAGILTRFAEYKKISELNSNLSFNSSCGEIGTSQSDIFDLYNRYYGILDYLGDACFFQCPRGKIKTFYYCNNLQHKKCRFALDGSFWEGQNPRNAKFDDKQIEVRKILENRIYSCNHNPWWLIVPLTHVFESITDCSDIDVRIKAYYQGKNGMRESGPLMEDFLKIYPLYANPQYNIKKLNATKNEFKRLIKKTVEDQRNDGSNKVLLQRVHTSPKDGTAKIIKIMLEDSGLTYKDKDCKGDTVKIHPFVVYVYSTQKIFEIERSSL